jgi:hypothetical protein
LDVIAELTKSRTGKHACRRIAFIVNEEGDIRELSVGEPCEPCKTYSKGEAKKLNVPDINKNEYLVTVRLVKNFRNHVSGEIIVYDAEMKPVYRAVYRKLKIRKTHGDPRYSWIPRLIADKLKLYVKRYNLD